MSTIKVSGNPTTNNNTLVVNFTTDASNISDILLSKDGGKNYISATSFTDTSAFFNINTWADGTYIDCMLKCVYSVAAVDSYTINNILTNVTTDNKITSINKNSKYQARITANSGYEINVVKVTMDGVTIIDSTETNDYIDVYIPNVTGDINITVVAFAKNTGDEPGQDTSGGVYDMMEFLTHGKRMNHEMHRIEDHPWCWTSVDYVYVIPGKTYTLSCNATDAWVYQYNENDEPHNLVSGTHVNPQTFTFTPTTDRIRLGCYDEYSTLSYFKLTTEGQAAPTMFSVKYNLSNCGSSNTSTRINEGGKYSTILIPTPKYKISTLKITMNGNDITDSVVSGDKINITNILGNIVITAVAIPSSMDVTTKYSITNDLTNCTTNNKVETVNGNSLYESIITANNNCVMNSILVLMDGEDVTNEYVTPILEGEEIPEPPVEEDVDVMSKMTYNKGINQTTGEIRDNTGCWATVEPITVETGKTYTVSCNATWLWVYGFDESDNYTSQLVLGSNDNPQVFTFTTDTTKIRIGCYDPNHQLTYCTLVKQTSGGNVPGGGIPITPNPGNPGGEVPDSVEEGSFRITAINPVSIDEKYATGEITPDRGTGITNLNTSKGQAFKILYCTSAPAVKHEISWDGGSTYQDKTSSITTVGTSSYTYAHEAVSVDSYNMAIRTTDADGNVDTKSFTIKFN